MKKLMLLLLLFTSVFALAACEGGEDDYTDGGKKMDDVEDPVEEPETMMFTLEELAMYDGKDGNDAYVAVNGVVYDVTGVSAWTNGTHNGNMAGTDVSNVINNAPHGESVLEDLEVVGELTE